MHSNLKKGLFLVTFLGMTVSPGISVMAADGDTAEAAKMPGVGIEAVLKDFYSQNREIKAEDYLVPENKGEYLDMAFANVTSFLYVRSEPTKESEYVGKLYPGYAAKITGPVGEWTAVESGDVTGYVKTEYILTGAEAQTYAENLDNQIIQKSIRAISEADMLIIGGTSLVVYPAAGFIDYFHGKYLVLNNKDATARDVGAPLTIHEPIGEVLDRIHV